MKAVVAMDSFKGSLTSLEAGEAVREGILRAMPDARVTVRPLSDGGEGTVEALTAGMGGRRERVTVTGPIGRPVEAVYGILDGGRTAVMEMSAAAGMLPALGFSLLDRAGRQVEPGARGLAELAEIRDEGALPELRECSFRVACDVTNPLCGERGASAVYGPQKGAGPAVIAQMDRWLADYAALCRRKYPRADPDRPGTWGSPSWRLPTPGWSPARRSCSRRRGWSPMCGRRTCWLPARGGWTDRAPWARPPSARRRPPSGTAS